MIHPQPKPRRIKHKGISAAKEAMSLWAYIVKSQAGNKCEYCGSVDRLQAHHIFTRSIASTRYEIDNGCALCAGHHKFLAHMKPHQFRDWITEKRGQKWWDGLRLRSNTRGKTDIKMLVIYLRVMKGNVEKEMMK